MNFRIILFGIGFFLGCYVLAVVCIAQPSLENVRTEHCHCSETIMTIITLTLAYWWMLENPSQPLWHREKIVNASIVFISLLCPLALQLLWL